MKLEKYKWLGINAPRYTSYPTAPNFSQKITSETYGKYLHEIEDGSSLSLYIHIPFCAKLCWFCGCATAIVNHYQPIADYLEFLLKEIAMVAAKANKNAVVSHIHFGGGSPTILNKSDFEKIINLIRESFAIANSVEISIEIDPRNVTEEKIDFYSKNGVDRVSVGVQDFYDQTQKAINRVQPFAMVENLFKKLRQNGIENINIDLIYGLPFQTIATIEKTLEQVILLAPQRIAFFSYAHVPWMKRHHNLIDESAIVDDKTRLEMFVFATDFLTKNGYVAIGIDHFAKSSDSLALALKNKVLRRNFQGYTADDAKSLIGLGLSSIGQLPQAYLQNSAKFKEYKSLLQEDKFPIIKGRDISLEDCLRKEVIDSLMCFMAVDLAEILSKRNFPKNYLDEELRLVADFYGDICQIDDKKIQITTKFKMAARAVASVFDKYLDPQKTNYSKVA